MRKIALALAILGTTLTTALYTAPAHAQATRTWVSGVGDDANPCSRTAPCKTFAGAISKTAAGGEIDALDPGGYGAVTITKSITIDGGAGQVASVLVAGTNGIVVSAGTNDVVILRNIKLQGLLGNHGNPGGAGLSAIKFNTGSVLAVDNCDIFGFNVNGVDVAQNSTSVVTVRNTTFRNITGNGVNITTTSGNVLAEIVNSSFEGFLASGTKGGGGVNAGLSAVVTVANSDFNGLATGAQAQTGGFLTIDTSTFNTNTTGISGAGTVNASNNSLYNNSTAFNVTGSATSSGNNRVVGALGTFSPGTMTQK